MTGTDATHDTDPAAICDLMHQAKDIAKRYRHLTGKPLGMTGEVGEFEAARLLHLKLSPPRQAGYDAVGMQDGEQVRFQIKTRVIRASGKSGQQMGSVRFKHKWDAILLVLLDEDLEPIAIYEAARQAVTDVLTAAGSKARNDRGQMAISKFKSIADQVWPRT